MGFVQQTAAPVTTHKTANKNSANRVNSFHQLSRIIQIPIPDAYPSIRPPTRIPIHPPHAHTRSHTRYAKVSFLLFFFVFSFLFLLFLFPFFPFVSFIFFLRMQVWMMHFVGKAGEGERGGEGGGFNEPSPSTVHETLIMPYSQRLGAQVEGETCHQQKKKKKKKKYSRVRHFPSSSDVIARAGFCYLHTHCSSRKNCVERNLHMYMARQNPQHHTSGGGGREEKKEKVSQPAVGAVWSELHRSESRRTRANDWYAAYLGRRLQSMLLEVVQRWLQWSMIRLLRRTCVMFLTFPIYLAGSARGGV